MLNEQEILDALILIVDDHPDNIEMMKMILENAGYTNVSATQNPTEVCDLHASQNFDLILLDLQMPGMNGFDIMKGLKEIEKSGYLPVLALSAQPNYNVIALERGARDFISKPFDLAEVERRIHNILEVRLLYKQLAVYSQIQQELALHDALTGLPNRRLLEDRINTATRHASRNHEKLAVMYLDLDGFKTVNDTRGHACGDEVLKIIGKKLQSCSRNEDTVARLGGDEFVVLLHEIANQSDVENIATKMLSAISQPFEVCGVELSISASIGISIYPKHGDTVDSLLATADKALYEAKHAGKCCFFISS